ncbi:MAG: dethiobiotin synthase [Lachnospiraceae bacterium]|nr:dethiobiotin synthase [Lachnospiraceae bacterium]
MSKNLFVTGTGTDVGKTYVTGLVIKKLRESRENAAYYKAAMSGNERRPDGTLIPGDALSVKEVSGIAQPLEEMCPYVYEHAYSPHLAASIEGGQVELSAVQDGFRKVSGKYDYVTMEGSGGILCPIRYDGEKIFLEDVIRSLGLSCLLIADAGLGTINNVVLTTAYMRARNIPIVGVIFNRFHPGDVMEEDNIRMCGELTGLKTLACVQEGDRELSMEAEALKALYRESGM